MVHWQICCHRPGNGGLGCRIWRAIDSLKDWLTWADSYRGTRCGDRRWEMAFIARRPNPFVGLGVKHFVASAQRLFTTFLSPVIFLSRKELYQKLVVGFASDLWGMAQLRRRFARNGIRHQFRASWTSSRLPGGSHRTHCLFPVGLSKRVW